MSAATTNAFAPSRGLFPVTEKPSESHESKAVFVGLVYRHLDSDSFKNIGEFEQWFKKTLVRRVVSEFGDDPKVGLTMISLAFPHGGMKHFMRWVLMKFTTTKSPEEAAAAAASAAAEDERMRELRKMKSEETQGFITRRRMAPKMAPKKRSKKEIAAMLEYGKTEVVIHSSQLANVKIPYVTDVTQELLESRHGTTVTIQELSGFLTTFAFDALVKQLRTCRCTFSVTGFSEKGWRQYLVDKFCSKKTTLSEENYEEEFQQKLREIVGRYGNWVIKSFTTPVDSVSKKSESPSIRFVGDYSTGKSYKDPRIMRLLSQEKPESDPDHVVFENCTPEEALLALWKETRVLGFGWLQQDGSPPTLEECREAANRGWVDYLKGKPIKINFKKFPVLYRGEYEEDAGKGKMQNVANKLRAKASASGNPSLFSSGIDFSANAVELISNSTFDEPVPPVAMAEVVEVIPLAEAVAVPVGEENVAPVAPRAE